MARQERVQMMLQAERELAETTSEARTTRTATGSIGPKGKRGENPGIQDSSNLGLQTLRKKVITDLERVDMVA